MLKVQLSPAQKVSSGETDNVPERLESQDLEQSGLESVDWIIARSQTSSDAGWSWGGNICVQSVGEALVRSYIHQTSEDTQGKALNT